jgi:fused signal recognition particle receptor
VISSTVIIAAVVGLVLVVGLVAVLVLSGRGKALPPASAEHPDAPASRLVRLRGNLARSQSTLGRGLLSILSRDRIDDAAWQELEDTLLAADLGVGPAAELVDALRTRVRVEGLTERDQAKSALNDALVAMVDPELDRSLKVGDGALPGVVLVVGVNGTGKTTTVGRLARILVAEGKKVLLGAADTFRAAAADQLQTWGERVGVAAVRGPEGSDPASVAFEAVEAGVRDGADVVLIDTAGRLHTKAGLMDELGKVKRVVEKQAPVTEVLLVIDATTGQNSLTQAKVFAEVADVTGIVLTKLDGTAKGGIVVAVQRELGVPVKYVGLGEGPDDLAPFDAREFVAALLDA